LIFGGYFFSLIYRKRKKMQQWVAIPTFRPPRDLSPASVNYLYRKGYKKSAFTATLVGMAVKGALSIGLDKKGRRKKQYFLEDKKSIDQLRPEEQQMHAALFSNEEIVKVNQANYLKFKEADGELEKAMGKQWRLLDYSIDSKKQNIITGVLVCLLITLNVVLIGCGGKMLCALLVASPLVTAALFRLLGTLFPRFDLSSIVLKTIGLMLLISIITLLVVWTDPTVEISWLSTLLFVVISVVYLIEIVMPTSEGAKVASELKGFRMYLKTAEEHRLNILNPPNKTPELFEKLLPYAIALGVSNQWCKKFNHVLQQVNYHPEWYTGKNKDIDIERDDYTRELTRLGTSFRSSVSSAKKSPFSSYSSSSSSSSSGSRSWSSGSSGGGHSGGGGGGTRVGGW
jgi:uncharacterized membrane protein